MVGTVIAMHNHCLSLSLSTFLLQLAMRKDCSGQYAMQISFAWQ